MPNNVYGSIVITDEVTDYVNLLNGNNVLGYQTTDEDFNSSDRARESNSRNDQEADEEELKKFGLFVKNVDGGKPDIHGKKFFALLNSRAGNIFKWNPETGEISLKNENIASETVTSSGSVSQTLAKLIDENIMHSVEENEKPDAEKKKAKQAIWYRVGNDLSDIPFDGYTNGKVDLLDLHFSNTKNYQNALQACMIFHFTHERVNTEDYEQKLRKKSLESEFYSHHKPACIAEAKVWNEMNNTMILERSETTPLPTDPRIQGNKTPTYDSKFLYQLLIYDTVNILIIKKRSNGRLKFEIFNP